MYKPNKVYKPDGAALLKEAVPRQIDKHTEVINAANEELVYHCALIADLQKTNDKLLERMRLMEEFVLKQYSKSRSQKENVWM